MKLESIYKYGVSKKINLTKNLVDKEIAAYILLNGNGEFLGIRFIDKKQRKKTQCPDIGTLANGSLCNPIVQKYSIIFNKSSNKYNAWKEIMKEGAENVECLAPIYTFIKTYDENESAEAEIKNELDKYKFKDADYISFDVDLNKIENDLSWKSWLDKYIRDRMPEKENKTIISSISGKEEEKVEFPAPMIKIGSVTGTGSSISAAPQKSFESYGLENNENSGIGQETAEILKATFEYLLKSDHNWIPKFNLLYWYSGNIEDSDDLIYHFLNYKKENDDDDDDDDENNEKSESNKNEKKLYSLIKSIEEGKIPPKEIKTNEYHTMNFFVPEKGRFFVSNENDGTYDELYNNLIKFYNDTSLIVNNKRYFIKNVYSIFMQLTEKKSNEKFEQMKNEFGSDFQDIIKVVFNGKNISRHLYMKALNRNTKGIIKEFDNGFGNTKNKQNNSQSADKNYKGPNRLSIQLIKLYLIRKGVIRVNEMEELSKNNNVAYNCGRLFSIYEQIQKTSNNFEDVNKGIADTYYSSCSRYPGRIFGILSRLSIHHINKLETKSKIFFEKKLSEVASLIGDVFPQKFNLDEQGCFALGYYHQKNDFYKKNKENENDREQV